MHQADQARMLNAAASYSVALCVCCDGRGIELCSPPWQMPWFVCCID